MPGSVDQVIRRTCRRGAAAQLLLHAKVAGGRPLVELQSWPPAEGEMRRLEELREHAVDLLLEAEAHAVSIFARNLRSLLLQPPLRGKRVLAIDPGFRTG